ncbi:efflux transporter outer membrane subunit [Rhizobacter sp. SG703]|uniref:efflux transporter outer membrane subunit n=1 Tax=Rhizobacter sp. SG703 TaxID=2587140 RepID=UPI0014455F4A|nr:efflux transporter outer membrane subunit [Rhizobacter sp. SG703]NKI96013.1 NodT family efflux transporter outer membrane factor (OMF) lipoprotein [Rhizobacter sp. SG703]
MTSRLTPVAALLAALLAGCSVAPRYQVPDTALPAGYKEVPAAADGWLPAAPADALDRGPWWTLFGDETLNQLAAQVEVSNQNVAAAVAGYAQSRSLVKEARASFFPNVSLSGGATRSGGNARTSTVTTYQAALGASWEAPLWGKLQAGVDTATATAQASEADLASARLSAQAALATNYFSLREADAEIDVVTRTVESFTRSQTITQNRYDAGVAPKSDLLQAQTQLANAQADLATLRRQRAVLEHAIAVLVGQAPAQFSLPPAAWQMTVPAVPLAVPSELLQRRPDIAGAERSVASANAQIGIARSAYFPSLSLSGSVGQQSSAASQLFNASQNLWSLGVSVAQTIFDAGATRARVEGAEASRDAAVARYRQTTLAALQAVEDQLSLVRMLAEQSTLRAQASKAADDTEVQTLNRYRAGQVSYLEVASAQSSALSARRALVQLQVDQQLAAIGLIQAMGGGWHSSWMPPRS